MISKLIKYFQIDKKSHILFLLLAVCSCFIFVFTIGLLLGAIITESFNYLPVYIFILVTTFLYTCASCSLTNKIKNIFADKFVYVFLCVLFAISIPAILIALIELLISITNGDLASLPVCIFSLVYAPMFIWLFFIKNKTNKTQKANKTENTEKKNSYAPPRTDTTHTYQNDTASSGTITALQRSHIDKEIKYLQNELKMPPFIEYTFNSDVMGKLQQYIQTSGKDDTVIKEIVGMILDHIGMIKAWVDVNVKYGYGSDENIKYAGTYNETGILYGKIGISIQPNYDKFMIIAIACHECAHYFLNKRRIRPDDTEQYEQLTDITTVYMGFGSYMIKGYANKRTSDNTGDRKTKLGYLNSVEMEYTHTEVRKLRFSEEIRQELIEDLKNDIKVKVNDLKTDILANKSAIQLVKFSTAYNTEGYLKLLSENFILIQNGDIDKWYIHFYEKLKTPQLNINDLQILQNEVEDYRMRISEYNKAINKFALLVEYQSNLSDDAISSIKKLHNDALHDDSKSLFMLIKYYSSIPSFSDEAKYYFKKLGECKNAEGFYCIGECYSSGIMVEKNMKTAEYYYYNAAQMGLSAAKEKFANTF